ncbi:MAG: hypothetical protein SPI12_03595 [Actinomycetaceae bacterium]|nr:hypothetical protein [Actinomycetaceae bacterium]MDY6082930.1 hypothetical protein [Actinomycetaceae bacterium]
MSKRKKKRNWDLPKPLALVFTIVVILAIPLPLALYFGGFDWITHGSHAGLKEFIFTYVFGLAVLCLSLGSVMWKEHREQKHQETETHELNDESVL